MKQQGTTRKSDDTWALSNGHGRNRAGEAVEYLLLALQNRTCTPFGPRS
jgi:hypothetical protein